MTQSSYYSDRHGPAVPRVHENITPQVWGGIVVAVQQRLTDGSLARAFPDRSCSDYATIITGADENGFSSALCAHVPQMADSLGAGDTIDRNILPPTPVALDVVEFVARHLETPRLSEVHSWNGLHNHYSFASGFNQQEFQERAQNEFRTAVETLFARNGMAFTFGEDLCVERFGPVAVRDTIAVFFPHTGDADLDEKLNDALRRFKSPQASDHEDAVEKLWDAFERLKTLELGTSGSLKASADRLLDRAAKGNAEFREVLATEFKALTDIGNDFSIRHHNHRQSQLPGNDATDYLFGRLLIVIEHVLRATGRITV